jgi:hypothetical protein
MAFPSEQVAREMVLRAKIARAIRKVTRRHEVRYYQCPSKAGWWHVTSIPEWENGEPKDGGSDTGRPPLAT